MDIKTDAHKTTIRQRPLIFLDLETTGLEVQKHEILEIGAIKANPQKPFSKIAELSLKVRPEHIENADKQALKIVGYSEKEWEGALGLKEALKQLEEFGQDGVLTGFNVSFDWAFLDKAYFALGKQDPFYYHRLDVMPMAYLTLFSKRSIKRFSLGEMARAFGVPEFQKHRALDDARVTYNIFKKLFKLKLKK